MNNKLHYKLFGTVFLIIALAACGGKVAVHTKTPIPQDQTILKPNAISSIEVTIASMHEDRIKLLNKNNIPDLIKNSMTEALKKGGFMGDAGPYRCMVEISSFVQNKWLSTTQVTLKVTIVNKSNNKVKDFTSSSVSTRAGHSGLSATFSDAAQKALNHL